MWWWSTPLYPRKWPGTHYTGVWLSPTAVLDGCGKSRPPPELDSQSAQLVDSRYTDYASLVTIKVDNNYKT